MLTAKQEKFVQELIKGKSQREAYRSAYPTSEDWKESAIDTQASILFKNSKVLERYNELTKGAIAKSQDDAESMRAFIIEKYKKIASGEICEESTEYDKDGNVLRTKKVVRPNDVNNAIAKLAEYYGVAPELNQAQDIVIKIEGCGDYSD